MSLRARFVLALVGLVAVATALIGAFSYRTTRAELLGQLDSSLQATTADLRRPGGVDRVLGPRSPASIRGDSDVIVQVVGADGTVYSMDGAAPLPVGASAEDLLDEPEGTFRWQDDSVDGTAVRVLTTSLGGGRGVLQVGRSLSETRQVLAALRTRILVASLVVVAAAAAVGVVLARQLTRRLVRLTAAAEEVRRYGRLDVDVDTDGTDEAARLGVAFREMLGALARSREDQQRLVQDAGHELRTPLTSLRTNVYTLRRSLGPAGVGAGAAGGDTARILDDLDQETEELSRLVDEVVEAATDRRGDEPEQPVDLGDLVERVAERARRRSGREVVVHRLGPATVSGRPLALERAVTNLVENALKFDSGVQPIEVTCEGGRVEVADRGPGIAAADRPHVFDRFYRYTDARSRPGSGLGLSIVAEVVAGHGGRTFAAERAGGGAVVGFVLPVGPEPAGRTGATA